MRRIAWKRILACTLVSALVLGTCGCSLWNQRVLGEGTQTIYRQETEQTVISYAWWGNDARHQYTLTGIRVFEDKNPDIRGCVALDLEN